MPKEIIEINPFHGGLNNHADPRDLSEMDLAAATDVMVDEIGKVRTMGSNSSSSMPSDRAVGNLSGGHGLFYFSHDRVGEEDAGSAQDETGENYLA